MHAQSTPAAHLDGKGNLLRRVDTSNGATSRAPPGLAQHNQQQQGGMLRLQGGAVPAVAAALAAAAAAAACEGRGRMQE